MRIRSVLSHALQALAEGALISLLVVGLVAGTALAARGGGSGKPSAGGGTISLVVLDADGIANHGDTVTFNISTTNTRPFVSLNCYQGSDWVYAASAGFFDDYPWSQDFILEASSWPSGAANCSARLYSSKDGIRTTTLATMTFDVAP